MNKKVIASAPGKVTLFGEHAVVYGYPALVVSIDKRIYAIAEKRNDDVIKINARDLRVPGIVISYIGNEVVLETDYGLILPAIAYINKAIEVTSKYIGTKAGVNIEIRSEMPVGAGLGTSAAVAVSTIAAYAYVNEYELKKEEIANLGWQVEKEVQGIASPMDTSITAIGGFLKIKYIDKTVERTPIEVKEEIPLLIGYVERESRTKDMVAMVRKKIESYPEIYMKIMELIGNTVEKAESALLNNNLHELGSFMNLNHSLLDALGVSTRRLNELVYVARDAGAYGSKLTGAGGGGCVIALTPENQDVIETAMKLHGTLTFRTKLGTDGVKIESVEI
ncbi:mevalonate kinase [Fervidicoccus fontis]|uniref:Mevalonate kinase n=3 Tax=Fervidicoccus TaxID=685950 RepID=I0A1D3_FERFK|nr:mevalonate kinase [Fervidicoccus fontis]AFH42790.1 mevalonate kinase [Fervidicoccus fontis Kam940]MBE9391576.1 mevalonate kinase [Fervidicoccus fontis]PMB76875.1 MAG: mevalonate kinase [Fervidicoccus fontis]HEW64139.1 mevalonate kinase [Fervidicoccus fontis]